MDTTTNYALKKPAYEEGADIEVLNGNMDVIDAELKKRPTLVDGKVPESQLPVQGGNVYSATAPDNTKLIWLDANNGGAAKYYNGTKWVNIPAIWG